MAKGGGLGDNFYLDQYDISGDTSAIDKIGGGNEALEDFAGIDKSAEERVGGIRIGYVEWTAFFNDAAGQAHVALKGLPLADRYISYFRGTTLGNPAASMVAKQGNYDYERGDDGSLLATVEAKANGYGIQWGKSLTAGKRTDTGATNGTGVDFGSGSTAFGAQFFLHVFAFSGTDVTIRVQESSDNGGGDPYANVTGGAFTSVTGVGAQRIATAAGQTMERYLRVATSTTGGFTSVTFAVVGIRNDTATVF